MRSPDSTSAFEVFNCYVTLKNSSCCLINPRHEIRLFVILILEAEEVKIVSRHYGGFLEDSLIHFKRINMHSSVKCLLFVS